MNAQSMTGYGKAELEGDKYSLSVEVKTVNHRFKDIRFKMGSIFNSKEIPLKKKIESKFSRGSFDIYINYKKAETKQANLELDYNKIKNFIQTMQDLAKETGADLNIQPTEFLRNDFYYDDLDKEDELLKMVDQTFERALGDLALSREEEGQKLIGKLHEHRQNYIGYFDEVKKLKNSYQDKVRDKLKKRFEDESAGLPIEEPRFLQEVIYYLEKLDIDEETNRIEIHLEKLDSILNSGGDLGRQIDFLIQELNRETNTIGSKSGDSVISENVVQMKVQLEKIREQALNLQ